MTVCLLALDLVYDSLRGGGGVGGAGVVFD